MTTAEEAYTDDLRRENEQLKAELAALRPWAEIGKWAVETERYINTAGDWPFCTRCMGSLFQHDDDCPIPALHAQLEAEDAKR